MVHNWDEQPPRLIYYGLMDDLTECQTYCYADNECFSATRYDLSGLEAANTDWPMRCWGSARVSDITMTSSTDADSAICLETRSTSAQDQYYHEYTFTIHHPLIIYSTYLLDFVQMRTVSSCGFRVTI